MEQTYWTYWIPHGPSALPVPPILKLYHSALQRSSLSERDMLENCIFSYILVNGSAK